MQTEFSTKNVTQVPARIWTGQEGPGVLQIECIANLWHRNEAATPTTPSRRRDRTVLIRGSPQIGSNVTDPPNVTE